MYRSQITRRLHCCADFAAARRIVEAVDFATLVAAIAGADPADIDLCQWWPCPNCEVDDSTLLDGCCRARGGPCGWSCCRCGARGTRGTLERMVLEDEDLLAEVVEMVGEVDR